MKNLRQNARLVWHLQETVARVPTSCPLNALGVPSPARSMMTTNTSILSNTSDLEGGGIYNSGIRT